MTKGLRLTLCGLDRAHEGGANDPAQALKGDPNAARVDRPSAPRHTHRCLPAPPLLALDLPPATCNATRESGEFGDGQLHRVAHAIVRELMALPPRKQRLAEPSRQQEPLRGFGVPLVTK